MAAATGRVIWAELAPNLFTFMEGSASRVPTAVGCTGDNDVRDSAVQTCAGVFAYTHEVALKTYHRY